MVGMDTGLRPVIILWLLVHSVCAPPTHSCPHRLEPEHYACAAPRCNEKRCMCIHVYTCRHSLVCPCVERYMCMQQLERWNSRAPEMRIRRGALQNSVRIIHRSRALIQSTPRFPEPYIGTHKPNRELQRRCKVGPMHLTWGVVSPESDRQQKHIDKQKL